MRRASFPLADRGLVDRLINGLINGLEEPEAEMRREKRSLAKFRVSYLTKETASPYLIESCYRKSMPFFISAESGLNAVSERRQTEPAAIGLALDYIDRGFSAVEIKDAGSGAGFCEEFLLAYSAIRRATK